MIRLILKNLWERKSRNAWLTAQLIIISVVLWCIFDPFITQQYIRSRPMGFPTERLYYMPYIYNSKDNPAYLPLSKDMEELNVRQAIEILKTHDDIENATLCPDGCSIGSNGYTSCQYDIDSTKDLRFLYVNFLQHSNFFQTYKFDVLDGQTAKDLDDRDFEENQVVTTDLVKRYFTSNRPVTGYKILIPTWTNEISADNYFSIVGCVKHVHYRDYMYKDLLLFNAVNFNTDYATLVFRIKENVSPLKFETEFPAWAKEHLKIGNYRPSQAYSFKTICDQNYEISGLAGQDGVLAIICIFLIINVILGVIGNFWFQTQKRHEEIGIMLSYGSTPRSIITMLMSEGFILSTISVIIGSLINLQFLFAISPYYLKGEGLKIYWVDSFIPHFGIISLIVYLIMLCTVLIGVYIPSKVISKMQICDALHNE